MENLVVTGATGKIGRALIATLNASRKNISIYALVRQRPTPPLPHGVHLIYGSLPDATPNEQGIPKGAIVIHLAGITHSCNPNDYLKTNAHGTQALLNLAKARSACHFIFASTRAIHPSGGPYSVSKRKAEELVQGSGIPYTILRFGEIYGTHGSEGIDRITSAVKNGSVVFLPGDGEARVAPVSLKQAIDVLVSATTAEPRNKTNTISAPREITLNTLVAQTKARTKRNPLVVYVPYWLMRLTAPLLCLFPHPPFYPDQIDRLVSPKEVSGGKDTV